MLYSTIQTTIPFRKSYRFRKHTKISNLVGQNGAMTQEYTKKKDIVLMMHSTKQATNGDMPTLSSNATILYQQQ